MKKSLFIALTIAAGAATAAPYYLPTSDYTRDLPPRRPSYDSSASYSCPGTPAASTTSSFGIEIGGTCITPDKDDLGTDMDLTGFDITGVYNIDKNWSVNLRFSWASDDKSVYADYDVFDLELTHWSIAPGVRYTANITDHFGWFVGANVGFGKTKASEVWKDTYEDEYVKPEVVSVWEDDATGVTYTIETGIRVNFNDNLYVYGSVMYWGTTAITGDLSKTSGYGFRAGLGLSF
jgi:opacity protein-like surface antigen